MVRRRSCAVSNHESPDAAILRDAASRLLRMRIVVHSKAVMTLPATFVIDTPGDAARAAELRRVKLLATSVLVATFAVFLGAKALVPMHPAFGFIAAFAEAATIGGLADWYAVVALFKRPLGLPIPHTAIIQSNQQRIADKLGEFIEVHFLEVGSRRSKAAADRFRLVHRRLAARPQAQRGSRALCAAAVAGSVGGDGKFRADDFRQPPHHRATDGDRSCAARCGYAARRS